MKKWARHNYQPCLPLGPDGIRISGSPAHIALSREAAREGIVLLKNQNGTLPLSQGQKVVLLGKASEEYIKGGGGSGDVTVAYVRNLYQSMVEKEDEGKVQLYRGLHDFYHESIIAQYDAGAAPGMTREPVLTEKQLREAAAFSDIAIVSICRYSGEGWDRHCEQEANIQAMETGCGEDDMRQASKKVFARGDFYLSQEEEKLVADAQAHFASVIVVLNVGGMVDTSYLQAPSITAALFAGQGGMEGSMAIGDILCGDANPCGKLADTFASSLEAYPSTAGFHASEDYVEYTEDIYVGYRYFETIPGKQAEVVYPFGYGLSYTTFMVKATHAEIAEDCLLCDVDVTNTGSIPGKQVIQLYVSAPCGKLGKPRYQLIDFEKTPLLQPGQTVTLNRRISLSALASYDDLGAVQKSAWLLEQGTYRFFLGTSVREIQELPVCHVQAEDRVTRQLTEKLKPRKLTRRMLPDGSYQAMACGEYPKITRAAYMDNPIALEGVMPETRAEKRCIFPWSPLAEELPAQLSDVADGKLSLDEFLDTLRMEEQIWLLGGQPNTGVANTFGMGGNRDHGIPAIMTADGPAGLRLLADVGVCTTAWPCATTLACTWNRNLVEKIGIAAALEVKENNIGIWLAPALNIHRSPLCGRNFEYYSEDPVVAGELASAMVMGIQSQGIAATPKHFAFNNKETNRKGSDSRVSERAAREIYLKAFETVVTKAHPRLIMSSYNLVNGCYTSENRELLTDILRDEWGFDGIVTTDWWTHAEHDREILAGNNVKMACGFPEHVMQALADGRLSPDDVRTCARRVLQMILWME